METLIEQIVTGAPNFIFAIVAVLALMRRLSHQDTLIDRLINQWAECEEEHDRAKISQRVDNNK